MITKNGKDASPILPLDQNHNKKLDFLSQESIENHNKPSKSILAENNEQLYIKSREKKINNCNTRAGGLAWLRYRLDMEDGNEVYQDKIPTEQILRTDSENSGRSDVILWNNYKDYLALKVSKLQLRICFDMPKNTITF